MNSNFFFRKELNKLIDTLDAPKTQEKTVSFEENGLKQLGDKIAKAEGKD